MPKAKDKPDVSLLAWDRNLWARCKTRKAHHCEICAVQIVKGAWAYRPLSENGSVVRYHRLCVDCGPRYAERILHRDSEA